jgi:anti-anti-sigma factor
MIGVSFERLGRIPIARPRGDIDAATADDLRERLAERMSNEVPGIVLDLSETRYVDSAGIDMLLRLSERLRQRRAELVLVIPPTSQLVRLADLVGLSRAMPVRASLEESLSVPALARAAQAPAKSACGARQAC